MKGQIGVKDEETSHHEEEKCYKKADKDYIYVLRKVFLGKFYVVEDLKSNLQIPALQQQ